MKSGKRDETLHTMRRSLRVTRQSTGHITPSIGIADLLVDTSIVFRDQRENGEDESKSTPNYNHKRRLSFAPNSPCLTPKLMRIIKNNTTENSPRYTVDIDVQNTPSSESFFVAEKRLKFQTPKSAKAMEMKKVKESGNTKVKKPRKGNRQGIDKAKMKLSSIPPPNFSVTKEAARIPLDAQCIYPWNDKNVDKLEELVQEIKKDFPKWFLYLREGFNIMLHGYGSKQPILDSLKEYIGKKFLTAYINGLFRQFNARKFLFNFVDFLHCEPEVQLSGHDVNTIVEDLAEKLSEHDIHDPAFILVTNFDVLAIRHPQMLTVLCTLARVPYIHIIAFCDHVNAGLGISSAQSTQLNFTWCDCTTLLPYTDELIWNASAFGDSNEVTAAQNTLEQMFKSLTVNSKKAFAILAKLQLQKMKTKKKGKSFEGVEFKEVARLCREAFIAHSDLVLKTLLSEFFDHKLITKSGKGKNDDNLIIELDEETLEKYAEN